MSVRLAGAEAAFDLARCDAASHGPEEAACALQQPFAWGRAELPRLRAAAELAVLLDRPEVQSVVADIEARPPLP